MGDVNIRSLARELQLSIGTVSKALKDSYEISVETKKRVLELAEKLQYRPNPYASSLRRKKSNTIAVVIPEVSDSFFSEAIKGIEFIAQQKGYHVLIYLTYESYVKERKILEDFKNGRVDGLLMSVSTETIVTDHIEDISNSYPFVFFDRAIEHLEAARVTTNDLEASSIATKHLIDKGCKNIVYLSISQSLDINNNRINGFKKTLRDHNLANFENSIIDCSNCLYDNEDILQKLFKSENPPDGIIASVEKLIPTVYSVTRQLKIRIPEDIKVICFSNLPLAHILQPALTTVTQPAFEIGKAAATLLFKALDKRVINFKKQEVVIPSSLMVRESTL